MSGTMKKRIRLFLAAVFFGYSAFKTVKVIGGLISGGHHGSHAPVDGDVLSILYYLVLYLALPLHLTCVGLLMQRPYLPALWRRTVFWAVVFSGTWLGISFIIRKFG